MAVELRGEGVVGAEGNKKKGKKFDFINFANSHAYIHYIME